MKTKVSIRISQSTSPNELVLEYFVHQIQISEAGMFYLRPSLIEPCEVSQLTRFNQRDSNFSVPENFASEAGIVSVVIKITFPKTIPFRNRSTTFKDYQRVTDFFVKQVLDFSVERDSDFLLKEFLRRGWSRWSPASPLPSSTGRE